MKFEVTCFVNITGLKIIGMSMERISGLAIDPLFTVSSKDSVVELEAVFVGFGAGITLLMYILVVKLERLSLVVEMEMIPSLAVLFKVEDIFLEGLRNFEIELTETLADKINIPLEVLKGTFPTNICVYGFVLLVLLAFMFFCEECSASEVRESLTVSAARFALEGAEGVPLNEFACAGSGSLDFGEADFGTSCKFFGAAVEVKSFTTTLSVLESWLPVSFAVSSLGKMLSSGPALGVDH
jgi:hypothetical protein